MTVSPLQFGDLSHLSITTLAAWGRKHPSAVMRERCVAELETRAIGLRADNIRLESELRKVEREVDLAARAWNRAAAAMQTTEGTEA